MKYNIVRFEFPDCFNYVSVVERRLTLEQAQAHCQRDDTSVEGEWFHGYTDATPRGRHIDNGLPKALSLAGEAMLMSMAKEVS